MSNKTTIDKIVGFGNDHFTDDFTIFTRGEMDEATQRHTTLDSTGSFLPFIIANSGVMHAVHGLEDHLTPKDVRFLSGDGFFDTRIEFPSSSLAYEAYYALADAAPSYLDRRYDTPTQFMLSSGQRLYQGMQYWDLNSMFVAFMYETSSDGSAKPRSLEISVMIDGFEVKFFKGRTNMDTLDMFEDEVRTVDPDLIVVYGMEDTFSTLKDLEERHHARFNFSRDPYDHRQSRYAQRRTGLQLFDHTHLLQIDPSTLDHNRYADQMRFDTRNHAAKFAAAGREIVDLKLAIERYNGLHGAFRNPEYEAVRSHFGLSETSTQVEQMKAMADIALPAFFDLAQRFPLQFPSTVRRGTAYTINLAMVGEYLRQDISLPRSTNALRPSSQRIEPHTLGYHRDVFEVDIQAEYPTEILQQGLVSDKDPLAHYPELLRIVLEFRVQKKAERDQQSHDQDEYRRLDLTQRLYHEFCATFYGLWNSRVGYGLNFNDIDRGHQVIALGAGRIQTVEDTLREFEKRELITLIKTHTDGIYFAVNLPPDHPYTPEEILDIAQTVHQAAQAVLPPGYVLKLSDPYEFGLFNNVINYAVREEGRNIMKGRGFIGKALEPYLVDFIDRGLDFLAIPDFDGLQAHFEETDRRIRHRELTQEEVVVHDIVEFTLEQYELLRRMGTGRGKMKRSAPMELATRAGGYKQGDPIAFYVGGNIKSISRHKGIEEAATFTPDRFNVPYAQKRLREKFEYVFPASLELLWDGI
tara:strand:+ start:1567 stop:3816 length:2250 start_codon:yes stop_codon:yes gene_type:complete